MNWKILYKYLQGEHSKEEFKELVNWLQESQANEDFFKTFVDGWDEDTGIEFKADARTAWLEFKNEYLDDSMHPHQMECSSAVDMTVTKRHSILNKKNRLYWFYTAAAAVILIASLYFVVENMSNLLGKSTPQKIAVQEITTSKGQRTNLRLSDGTRVILNSKSKLRIPENYGTSSRIIYLEGEAFFDVKHDLNHPFTVISYDNYVKDLGTQFNIMAYDSTQIEVAVKVGLVALGNTRKGNPQKDIVKLSPNKLAILNRTGGLTVSNIEDLNTYMGWTKGKLVFQHTPFPKVIKRLERWFDIECIINNPELSQRTLTATYDKMPMSEVLKVLSLSLHISYERQGRTIVFSDKNRNGR